MIGVGHIFGHYQIPVFFITPADGKSSKTQVSSIRNSAKKMAVYGRFMKLFVRDRGMRKK